MKVEVEKLATRIRRLVGLASDEIAYGTRFSAALLGPNHVALDPHLPVRGLLERRDRGWFIILRELDSDFNFTITHEVAHYVLRVLAGYRGLALEEERLADSLAAALLAPAGAVRKAHKFFGDDYPKLARPFTISQTSLVLRLGEVLEDERGIITRSGHRLVGFQRSFPWARVDSPGVVKAPLHGGIDVGRTAVRLVSRH